MPRNCGLPRAQLFWYGAWKALGVKPLSLDDGSKSGKLQITQRISNVFLVVDAQVLHWVFESCALFKVSSVGHFSTERLPLAGF